MFKNNLYFQLIPNKRESKWEKRRERESEYKSQSYVIIKMKKK